MMTEGISIKLVLVCRIAAVSVSTITWAEVGDKCVSRL